MRALPSSWATSFRRQRPRPHLRHRQRAGRPLLVGGENRHQQRHARQLGGGLVNATPWACGGQCQRRCDARCERHQRRAPVWAAVMGFYMRASPAARRARRRGLVQPACAVWACGGDGPDSATASRWRLRAASGLCRARSSLCLLSITELMALYPSKRWRPKRSIPRTQDLTWGLRAS